MEYCEKTDDAPPPSAAPGATPARIPPVAGEPASRSPPASLSPDEQQIQCYDRGELKVVTISCVSGWSKTGRGICEDPRTLQLMDQWLTATRTYPALLDCWGRPYPEALSGARRTCQGGKPDTNGRTRCEYLKDHDWGSAPGLGTMMDYVNANL